ncbi:PAS domain-containing protein [Flavobacterium sp. ZS1P14]|uniref:PAS domain-containing protein n=1 Tax=Flavobacterium sp. ZS1P14 TaxID=3401729 RepID=UPI003AB07796
MAGPCKLAKLHSSDDHDRVMNSIVYFFESKENFWSSECRYLDNKGKVYYFSDSGYLVRDQDGKPIGTVGVVADITSLKDHIIELKAQRRFL